MAPTTHHSMLLETLAGATAGAASPAPLLMSRWSSKALKVLANADVKARFAGAGSEVNARNPAEFAAYVKGESERWAELIRKRGIKLD